MYEKEQRHKIGQRDVKHATQQETSSIFSCTKAEDNRLWGITMGTRGTVAGKDLGHSNTKACFGRSMLNNCLVPAAEGQDLPHLGLHPAPLVHDMRHAHPCLWSVQQVTFSNKPHKGRTLKFWGNHLVSTEFLDLILHFVYITHYRSSNKLN